jgi:glutaminyl-peptide cyclotransferase
VSKTRQRVALCLLVAVACGACAEPVPTPETAVAAAPAEGAPVPVQSTIDPPSLPLDAEPGSPDFVTGNAWEHLVRQVSIGPRPSGGPAIEATRQYIRSVLEHSGIEVREQAFDAETPVGTLRMVNLVATLPGRRAERIALGSHYDTKRFTEFRFVGASDGASSTAVLLELGRALQQRDREFTIELIFFDGEEATRRAWEGTDHTYGSRHYVSTAQQSGTLVGLEALILLDMVGDRNLNFRREATSTTWLTDIIWAAAARLGHEVNFLDQRTAIEDDHYPFLAAGVAATDIIDLDYPAWHTPADDLDQVSARSLEVTGRTVLEALPDVEQYIATSR